MNPMEEAQYVALAREWCASGGARLVRNGAGLSLREIAALAEISPTSVLRYERGARRPRGAPAARYGRVLREISSPAWHLARLTRESSTTA